MFKTSLLNTLRQAFAPLCVLLAAFLILPLSAKADAPFSDNFEWWTESVPHTLVNGNTWYSGNNNYWYNQQIISTTINAVSPYEGQRMLGITEAYGGYNE